MNGLEKLTDADWVAELDSLANLLVESHPCPFRAVSENAFSRRLDAARNDMVAAPVPQRLVTLASVVASLRDGHTRMSFDWRPDSSAPNHAVPNLPIELELLEDGLLVTAAAVDSPDLVGGRVERIDDTPVELAVGRCAQIVSGENQWRTRALAPKLLGQPLALQGLGVAGDSTVNVTVRKGDQRVTRPVAGDPGQPMSRLSVQRAPGLAVSETNAECLHLASGITMLKYDMVRDLPGRPLRAVFDEALVHVSRGDVLITDLRHNSGGDNRLTWPLVHGLAAMPSESILGRHFVLIGPRTFSAAMNAVVALERHTPVQFIGLPTGAAPNHFGDAQTHFLERTNVAVDISTLWWQESYPYDQRTAVEPHHQMDTTIDNYLAQRDPCVEAVLDIVGYDQGTSDGLTT